jgi:hypothetical protein
MWKHLFTLGLAAPLALVVEWGALLPIAVGQADEPAPAAQKATSPQEAVCVSWTTAVQPKPLSSNAKKGLDWLVEHQDKSGGWGQGEESANMGTSDRNLRDTPNVADTCIAALALMRSGSTPREGPYKDAIARAVRFVRAEIEESDASSMTVTRVNGTRVQQKLGPNIDTFLASLFMAEVKGQMPDEPANKAVDLALNKVLDKIRRNQKADGTWDNRTGWAPVLAQSIGGKGLNRAAQKGVAVDGKTLALAEDFAKIQVAQIDAPASAATGRPAEPSVGRPTVSAAGIRGGRIGGAGATGGFEGAAGVELYSRAASLGVLQDSVNSHAAREPELRKKVKEAKDDKERSDAQGMLDRIDEAKKAQFAAQAAVIDRLGDKQFISGFGSNGGEEFLSYMNIAESLVVKGGADWKKWDAEMTANLNRVQNGDGSWSGHHCITGRTFCTSSALLVLLADRTPVPALAKDSGKEDKK